MSRILCIEDAVEFQTYLAAVLKEHTLVFAQNAAEAVQLVESGRDHFDLVLLDVSLPDGNGLKILPKIKSAMSPRFVPIMILSSDADIITKVAAFGVGADDYISKPPDSSELRARVEAKLRIAKSVAVEKNTYEFGGVVVDTDKMTVEVLTQSKMRKQVDLTPYEFKILKLLLSRPGQVYSRENIIDRVWGIDKYITTRTVDAHVSHLRKKLNESSVQIETVLSTGYKLCSKDDSSMTESK